MKSLYVNEIDSIFSIFFLLMKPHRVKRSFPYQKHHEHAQMVKKLLVLQVWYLLDTVHGSQMLRMMLLHLQVNQKHDDDDDDDDDDDFGHVERVSSPNHTFS